MRFFRGLGEVVDLSIELADVLGEIVKAKAQEQGVSVNEQETSNLATVADRPIWEVILDNMSDVPRKAFESLPKEGASEVDHLAQELKAHYLCGHPKRNQ